MGIPSIDTAKSIWNGESGFRKINNYLCLPGTYLNRHNIRGDGKSIEHNDVEFKTGDVIDVLKNNMTKSNETKTYYRGGTRKVDKSFKKEGFISLSVNFEDTIPFSNDGDFIFLVTVDPDVLRLKTGVEGETLLEDGCYWEVTQKISKIKDEDKKIYCLHHVYIHSPSNPKYNYPLLASITNPQFKKVDVYPTPEINRSEIMDDEMDELNDFMEEMKFPPDSSSVSSDSSSVSPRSFSGGNRKRKRHSIKSRKSRKSRKIRKPKRCAKSRRKR